MKRQRVQGESEMEFKENSTFAQHLHPGAEQLLGSPGCETWWNGGQINQKGQGLESLDPKKL